LINHLNFELIEKSWGSVELSQHRLIVDTCYEFLYDTPLSDIQVRCGGAPSTVIRALFMDRDDLQLQYTNKRRYNSMMKTLTKIAWQSRPDIIGCVQPLLNNTQPTMQAYLSGLVIMVYLRSTCEASFQISKNLRAKIYKQLSINDNA
jgi:hypothetical protein